tara:strand:+ start:126204 stop:127100 length:897 start_codon:yes stop_codon:yes gene_type:complete
MAAVRLSFTWLGVRRTLTPQQKSTAAGTFGAEGDYLSAGKKLLNTKHPKFKAVTTVRGEAVAFWKNISVPWPEPGIRLMRQDGIRSFDQRLRLLSEQLDEAVAELDHHFDELKESARDRLGSLFNEADYPSTLRGAFGIAWDFPAVEPPNYLRQLNPELYEQECDRVRTRFAEAARLAEEAFIAELSEIVSHLCERLSGEQDARPKIFRDSAINNLTDFFARFRSLNVGSNDELERLVDQAQNVLHGVRPQALRTSGELRQHVATQLSGVQSVLDGLMVDRPRRNILRHSRPEAEAAG